MEELGLMEDEMLDDGLMLGLLELDGLIEREIDELGLIEALGDIEALGLCERLADELGLREAEGLWEAEGEIEADEDELALELGLREADGELETDALPHSEPLSALADTTLAPGLRGR